MSDKWTERLKADRAKMANELARRLLEAGAVVKIMPEGSCLMRPHRITLHVSATDGERTALLCVDFDGRSCQPDIHVATWNAKDHACFSEAMKEWTLNPYHFGKATRVCQGFEALASELVCDVMRITSGEAFSTERETALRRKYDARGWSWN